MLLRKPWHPTLLSNITWTPAPSKSDSLSMLLFAHMWWMHEPDRDNLQKSWFFFSNFKEQIWCWKPTCPSLARKFLPKWTNYHYWKQIPCWCPSWRSMYPICFILKQTLSTVSNSSKSTKIQIIFSLKLSSHCLSILLWNSSCSRWALNVLGRRNQRSLDDWILWISLAS